MAEELTIPDTAKVKGPSWSHAMLLSGWFVTWSPIVMVPVTWYCPMWRTRVAWPLYVQLGGPLSCIATDPTHLPVTFLAGESPGLVKAVVVVEKAMTVIDALAESPLDSSVTVTV